MTMCFFAGPARTRLPKAEARPGDSAARPAAEAGARSTPSTVALSEGLGRGIVCGMNIVLGRQPIFGRDHQLVGYVLSYGIGAEAAPWRSMLADVFLGAGLEQATGGYPAYLETPRDLLLSGDLDLLDPDRIVLLPSGIDPADPEAVEACRRLVDQGYRLVLDLRTAVGAGGRMIRWADAVRLDLSRLPVPAMVEVAQELRRRRVRLMAENVEGQAAHEAALGAGVELFRGYRYSRPEVLMPRDLPVEYIRAFRLMQLVRDWDVTDLEVETEFRADPSLSYKLLRMANTAAVGARGVRSIGHAIRLLGREVLYRWMALLLLSTAVEREVEAEMVRTSLRRARHCELIAPLAGRPAAAGSLYVAGLLSLTDLLLGAPMEEIVRGMGLAPEVEAALIRRDGFHGAVLHLVEAYDDFRWAEVMDRCSELGVQPREVGDRYMEALAWAEQHAPAAGAALARR